MVHGVFGMFSVLKKRENKMRVTSTSQSGWCQGLRCARLRELCVDAWPSLEDGPGTGEDAALGWLAMSAIGCSEQLWKDAGVQMLVATWYLFGCIHSKIAMIQPPKARCPQLRTLWLRQAPETSNESSRI